MPSEDATASTPLAPSVEKAYYRKCIELKRRMNEIQEANDAARLRKIRLERAILKMRFERAMMLEQLAKRMDYTAEGSEEKYKHLVRHNLVTSCENDSSAVQSNGRGSIEHHDPSPDQFVGAQGSVDSRPPVDPLQADNLRQGIHPPPIAVPAYPVNYEDVSLRQDHKGPWYHIPDRIINPQHGLVPEQYAGIGLIAGSQHYAVPPQHFGSAHVARSHHHMWPQQYTGLEHTSRAPYLRPSNVDSQNLPGPQNHGLSKHRQDVQSNVNASPSTKEPLKSTKQKKPSNNRKGMVPGHKYRTYQQRCSACNGRRNSCLRLAECPPRP